MSWKRVWTYTFATEEAADVAYDRLLKAQELRMPYLVGDVDRVDGHQVSLAFSDEGIEKLAKRIESSYVVATSETPCKCGHSLVMHGEAGENDDEPCRICGCGDFERADWPPDDWFKE